MRTSRLEATGFNVSAGGTCIKTCAAESVKLAGGSFAGHASGNMGEPIALIVTGQSKMISGRRIVSVVGGGFTLTAESVVPCAGCESSALSVTVDTTVNHGGGTEEHGEIRNGSITRTGLGGREMSEVEECLEQDPAETQAPDARMHACRLPYRNPTVAQTWKPAGLNTTSAV